MKRIRTWHEIHEATLNVGQRLADSVAREMGSWRFIIIQTFIVMLWMVLNVIAFMRHWDPYPYILLNLVFSTQAAYAAPIIMMSQNRQSDRDRAQAEADYKTNLEAKQEIENLQLCLNNMETDKLDKIITMLQEMRSKLDNDK